jgi:hypothetical protein
MYSAPDLSRRLCHAPSLECGADCFVTAVVLRGAVAASGERAASSGLLSQSSTRARTTGPRPWMDWRVVGATSAPGPSQAGKRTRRSRRTPRHGASRPVRSGCHQRLAATGNRSVRRPTPVPGPCRPADGWQAGGGAAPAAGTVPRKHARGSRHDLPLRLVRVPGPSTRPPPGAAQPEPLPPRCARGPAAMPREARTRRQLLPPRVTTSRGFERAPCPGWQR